MNMITKSNTKPFSFLYADHEILKQALVRALKVERENEVREESMARKYAAVGSGLKQPLSLTFLARCNMSETRAKEARMRRDALNVVMFYVDDAMFKALPADTNVVMDELPGGDTLRNAVHAARSAWVDDLLRDEEKGESTIMYCLRWNRINACDRILEALAEVAA